MLIAGLIIVALGLALAVNILRSSDRLAALATASPWWIKGPLADLAAGWRLFGIALIVLGAAFAAIGLGIRLW